mmetsp:Transcript_12749/g.47707  ORF Transcript_12749/g.47707 Transcript_12749/m.47707 type:complete len:332 (+) Transcript_12749:210-1205(+)
MASSVSGCSSFSYPAFISAGASHCTSAALPFSQFARPATASAHDCRTASHRSICIPLLLPDTGLSNARTHARPPSPAPLLPTFSNPTVDASTATAAAFPSPAAKSSSSQLCVSAQQFRNADAMPILRVSEADGFKLGSACRTSFRDGSKKFRRPHGWRHTLVSTEAARSKFFDGTPSTNICVSFATKKPSRLNPSCANTCTPPSVFVTLTKMESSKSAGHPVSPASPPTQFRRNCIQRSTAPFSTANVATSGAPVRFTSAVAAGLDSAAGAPIKCRSLGISVCFFATSEEMPSSVPVNPCTISAAWARISARVEPRNSTSSSSSSAMVGNA